MVWLLPRIGSRSPFWAIYYQSRNNRVYNVETNEWHFIASLPYLRQLPQVLFHGTKLYMTGGDYYDLEHIHAPLSMDCYDIETNECTTKIAIPQPVNLRWDCFRRIAACSVIIPKTTLKSFRTLKIEKERNCLS